MTTKTRLKWKICPLSVAKTCLGIHCNIWNSGNGLPFLRIFLLDTRNSIQMPLNNNKEVDLLRSCFCMGDVG